MSEYACEEYTDVPFLVERVWYLLGTGAAVPTVVNGGLGATFARTSAGLYSIAWKENPGIFLGVIGAFSATVPAGVAALVVTAGAYVPATFTLPITVQTTAGVATDLAALQNLTLKIQFKKSGKGV